MGWSDIPIYEYVSMVICWFSFGIYVEVVYIIIKHRSRSSSGVFRGPFFLIFIIQTLLEMLMFLTINFMNRPRKYRIFDYQLTDDSKLVRAMFFWHLLIKSTLYIGHVLMAFNRFTAFWLTDFDYRQVWDRLHLLFYYSSGCALLVIVRLLHFYGDYQYQISLDDQGTIFIRVSGNFSELDAIIDVVLCGISAALCLAFYGAALYLSSKIIIIYGKKRLEMCILRSALFIFLLFVPMVIRSGLQFYWNVKNNKLMLRAVAGTWSIFTEWMCMSPVLMLIFSYELLRRQLFFYRMYHNYRGTVVSPLCVTSSFSVSSNL